MLTRSCKSKIVKDKHFYNYGKNDLTEVNFYSYFKQSNKILVYMYPNSCEYLPVGFHQTVWQYI